MASSEGSAANWSVTLHRKALRELSRLPKPIVQRCWMHIKGFETNPLPVGTRPLRGQSNLYRVRVGQYRIIYRMNDEEKAVLVLRVAHRKDVYKDL